jgi:Cys-tRNA(Pro)/Cys-tRNA(Cys) deacylase
MAQTQAIAAAEQAGIAFEIRSYSHDPNADSYGLEAARMLELEPGRVFKTLVIDIDGTVAVALVPVARQLDLKAFGKRVALAQKAAAERTTGYVLGGISPLGLRRALPTTLDSSALGYETIFVSAGRRGLELELDPRDLVRLTGADVRQIAA